MSVKTESPADTGLSTIQISNDSLAADLGKPATFGGFTKLPNAVLLDSSLSAMDCRLYALLAHHQGVNAESWPSQKLLAAELDVSSSTVWRSLQRLEAAGLVKTRQVGLRRTNRYQVLNPGLFTDDEGCAEKPVNMPDSSRVKRPIGRRTKPPKPLHYVQSLSRQNSSLLPSPSISIEISEEVRRVQSQIPHHGVEEVEETKEPAAGGPQLAGSSSSIPLHGDTSIEYELEELGLLLDSSLALYFLHGEELLSLVGIEPPRLAESSGFVTTDTEGERVVSESEEVRYRRVSRERELAGVCHDCGGSEGGVEVYRSCLRCLSCRAEHAEIDRKLDEQIDAEKNPHGVKNEFKSSAGPEPLIDHDTRAAVVSEPAPWASQDERTAWEKQEAARASEVERLPRDELEQAPATKRDLEGLEERLIEEIPLAVAIAVGGHPAEEGALYTAADVEERRQDE